jgi:hypothetical protein
MIRQSLNGNLISENLKESGKGGREKTQSVGDSTKGKTTSLQSIGVIKIKRSCFAPSNER